MPRKTRRRAPGEGTVYQRKDGRWVGELTLEDGKRKYYYGKTQAIALERLQQAQYEMKQGILATGPQQKVADYLNYWLDQVRKHKIRASTHLRYRIARDKHIIPALGEILLQKLTTRKIQQFYNEKLEGGQSPSSVLAMQKVLHGALEQAVKERLISINPAKGVSLPKVEKRKLEPLTLEQAISLLKAAKGTMMESFVALAMLLGMRHGEILALHWKEIDFERGKISVKYTLTHTQRDGKYCNEIGDPKTKASNREIVLPAAIANILREHRARQNEMRLKAGSSWHDQDLVFCTKNGGIQWKHNILPRFYLLLKSAGLPDMHVHDLRHNAVTLLISLGVNPKIVQQMMGHEDIETTMLIYGKVNNIMQIEAEEKIDGLLKRLL
jgi:integrase